MIGIFVGFVVSWFLLYFLNKKNLTDLWFSPYDVRLKQFLIGFAVTAGLCIPVQLFEALLTSSSWSINEDLSGSLVLEAFYWDFKSVLTEELIFRGALLYILIQRIGSKWSLLISAAAFGIYHWFSFGILGNLVPMTLVFLGTGIMGYAWALAFARTNSIILPFGLHFGWNFVQNTVFSNGPLGNLILVSSGGEQLGDWESLLNFSIGMILVPILVLIFVRRFPFANRI